MLVFVKVGRLFVVMKIIVNYIKYLWVFEKKDIEGVENWNVIYMCVYIVILFLIKGYMFIKMKY